MRRAGHHALDQRVVVFLDIDLQLDRLLGVFENFKIGITCNQRILCVGQILIHLHVVFFDRLIEMLNYADLLDKRVLHPVIGDLRPLIVLSDDEIYIVRRLSRSLDIALLTRVKTDNLVGAAERAHEGW